MTPSSSQQQHDPGRSAPPARLLVVVPRLVTGGTELHLLQVLSRLDPARFAVTLFTTQGVGPLDGRFRAAGLSVVPGTALPGFLPARLRALFTLTPLYVVLHQLRPGVVHFFLPEAYLIGGCASLLTVGPRRVMSRRSLNLYQQHRPLARRLEGWLHRRMDALTGNSQRALEELAAEGAPEERLLLLPNGTDLDRFRPPVDAAEKAAARRALGLPDKSLILAIAATLLPYKGHADLLQALAHARDRAKDRLPEDWLLVVAGRDPGLGAELRGLAQGLGIGGQVRWAGEMEDTAPLLRAADIGLLCSHEESLPNAVMEGMAAGLPMIATAVGGCAELIEEGKSGLLVPPRDPEALASAILELAAAPERRQALGRAAREAAGGFSLEACVARYEALYEGLLAGRSAAEIRAEIGCGATVLEAEPRPA